MGKLQAESIEQDLAVSHWITPVPVAVAGFNYGEYQSIDIAGSDYGLQNFRLLLNELPDNARISSA